MQYPLAPSREARAKLLSPTSNPDQIPDLFCDFIDLAGLDLSTGLRRAFQTAGIDAARNAIVNEMRWDRLDRLVRTIPKGSDNFREGRRRFWWSMHCLRTEGVVPIRGFDR